MSVAAVEGGEKTGPLSVAQEAMWLASRLAPTRLTYNETISIRKDGPLDVPTLRRAWAEIMRRHESLRTNFEVIDGTPMQVVRPVPDFDLPVHDLGDLDPEEAERHAVEITAEAARTPYDLTADRVVRPQLFRFPGEHHRLYLPMHHLAFDGVSFTNVVLPELVAIYDAFGEGRPSPLPEPTTTYRDYARWEQEWIEGKRGRRRLAYQLEHLLPPPELPIPLDHPRREEPCRGGGVTPLAIPAAQVERLRGSGQAGGASLFQVLATCWALLLSRYSGRSEVVFATAADLRQRPEFQGLVGCCVTPSVLRLELGDDLPFAELVTRVRNELLDGLDRLVPFERVVRELPPSEERVANPVYQTMLVLEPATKTPDPSWSLHQIDSAMADAAGSFKLDLELQLDERADGHITGQLVYDRDLFETATAERIGAHWLAIVGAVAADPDISAAAIEMLSPAERRRQEVEWNATAVERPGEPEEPGSAAGRALERSLGIGPGDDVLTLPAPGIEIDGEAVAELVRERETKVLVASPEVWRELLDTGLHPPRSLHALSLGGPLPQEVADELQARCRALWCAYAPTGCEARTLGRIPRGGRVDVGRPLDGVTVRVLDRHGHPAPIGVVGELLIDEAPTGDRGAWTAEGRLRLAG
jgi:hypothetical protein